MDIVLGILLLIAVAGALVYLWRKKDKGRGGCPGCGNCYADCFLREKEEEKK